MSKKIKFIIATVIIIALAASVFAIVSFSQNDPRLVVESKSASRGDIVEIDVEMKNNPGIVALQFKVSYDNSVLELLESQDKNLFGVGKSVFCNDITMNPYNMLWENGLAQEETTDNGTVVTLKFKVLEQAALGETTVSISADRGSTFDIDLNDVSFEMVNGTVTIEENSSMTVQAGSVSGFPGEEVVVPLEISGNTGMIGLGLSVNYDSSILVLTGVENGNIFNNDCCSFGNDMNAVPYKLYWEDGLAAANNTGNGLLVNLVFRIKSSAQSGNTAIELSNDAKSTVDIDLSEVSLSVGNGFVSVQERHLDMPTVYLEEKILLSQETVSVPIMIKNNPGIIALGVSVSYDGSQISLIGVENGSVFSDDCFVSGNDLTAESFNLLWADALTHQNITSDGILATLNFEIKDFSTFDKSLLTISYFPESTFDVSLNEVEFETSSAQIKRPLLCSKGQAIIDYYEGYVFIDNRDVSSLDEYVFSSDPNTAILYKNSANGLGTGTEIAVTENGITIEKYTLVIYGDVDGDGKADGRDAVIVNCITEGLLLKSDVGETVFLAADCNQSKLIDSSDVEFLINAGLKLGT